LYTWRYNGQADCALIFRVGIGGFAERFKVVPFSAKVALYLVPFLDEQLQSVDMHCREHKEATTMFSGGNVTVYVSNMDRAVRFYSETLGLKLAYRFGDHWASIEAGTGLTIGLHPASSEFSAGRKGSMAIGLQLKGALRDAVSALKAKGIRFQGDVINEGKAGSFIGFEDPDGNQLYLAELNWSHVEKGEGQYQPAKA
jgi:catechol 2,3-dioxygenase-like lactoylglutathione lyase family enzyme